MEKKIVLTSRSLESCVTERVLRTVAEFGPLAQARKQTSATTVVASIRYTGCVGSPSSSTVRDLST